ncbi:MAG: YfcE family phosphodiesterase [Candidatus Omnitrophota bacterium]
MADIHGNYCAFRAILDFLNKRVQKFFFAGDLVGYYPFVHECLALWDSQKIMSVRGNHDQMLLDYTRDDIASNSLYQQHFGNALMRSQKNLTTEDFNIMSSWSRAQTIKLNGLKLAIFHGAPWDELEGRVYPDFNEWNRFNDVSADIIVMGHTHYPFSKKWRNKIIVNPGSVGQPRNEHGAFAFCSEIDLRTMDITQHRIAYDAGEIIHDSRVHGSKKLNLEKCLIACGKK